MLNAANTNEFLALGLDSGWVNSFAHEASGGGSRRSGIEFALDFAAALEEANVTFFLDPWEAGVDVRAAETTTSGLGGVLARNGRRRLSSGLPTSLTRHSRNVASSARELRWRSC